MLVDLLYDVTSTIESQYSVTRSARQNGPCSSAGHADNLTSNHIRIDNNGEYERNQRRREGPCFVSERYWFSSTLLVPFSKSYSGRPFESAFRGAVS
jgi:hypothetical protein